MPPALDGSALRLIKHHAPSQFDQGPADAGITGLGDGQVAVTLTGAADPTTQAGVTADLFAVFEARPVAEFGDEHPQRQRAQTFGALLGSECLNLFGQGFQESFNGQDELAPDVQSRCQPVGQVQWGLPPFATQPDALGQTQTAALGGQPLTFPA